jgi:nucleoside-diphosphate-sugar epimerase
MAGKVVVAGASGVVGSAAVHRFRDAGWDVVAVSRRAPELEGDGPGEVEHVAVDLRDADATATAFANVEGVTHLAYAALYEKPGLIQGWTEHDQMETNDRMLRNLVDALQRRSDLEHISLLQGTKAYGIHLHPIPVPARERAPRDDHENFYWLQEDFVREQADRTGLRFTVLRPQVIFGGVHGAAMNVLPVIGAYAALTAEEGIPFGFPGGPGFLQEAVDARLMGDVLLWAAETPAAADETFNVTNGDVFEWRQVWPAIADALGVEPADDERREVVPYLVERQDRWQRLNAELEQRDRAKAALLGGESHHYADFLFGYALDERPPYGLVSTVKLRQAGFSTFYDTEDTLRHWLGDLIRRRVIPYLAAG